MQIIDIERYNVLETMRARMAVATPIHALTTASNGPISMDESYIPQDGVVVTRIDARASGLKRYFSGEPCTHGHISERQVSSNVCLQCAANDRRDAEGTAQRRALRRTVTSAGAIARDTARAEGSSTYDSSVRCIHGHVGKRATASGKCMECWNEHRKTDKHRAYKRRHCAAGRAAGKTRTPEQKARDAEVQKKYEASEKRRLWIAAWLAANPGRMAGYNRNYKNRNREKLAAYRAANRTILRAAAVAWRKANREKVQAYRAARRAREAQAPGRYTGDDVAYLNKLQHGKCAHSWCRVSLKNGYHVDHIKALAIGGSNDRRNLQLLCPHCNRSKGAKHPVDFAQQHGALL
jgi:5-methylcytosine-specific restriction endonuclease McrA